MTWFFAIALVCMQMRMGVSMGVRVYEIVMRVLVDMHVGVHVVVLQSDGIADNHNGGSDHDEQCYPELDVGTFAEKHHAKSHAEEWCDGVVGAGFGGPKVALRHDIKGDAEPVGDKS